ncbi:hypothetical protein A33Q_3363 [Indibacter alkaliphilus LW1]|uniref:Fibrobacter succinogenes major paralogous domain-containing protein n=1 Tax=Indibacter alkaliphilus (strain CCUG 57479 / KCTC 22604 / LW1) TaxID=1189612 RepID=S2DZD4_INDAL|nr:FISUMP domain-containing protein [Indibacter alkaliphilus]EOZ95158.1 hypothetical protein A33Q_3363 [Indibacter alkaliphilus LW1]
MKTETVLKSISKSLCLLAFLILIYSCQEKESPVLEEERGPTITDIEGNVYDIVEFGETWWMVQNLKTTKYRDGTVIPKVESNEEWSRLESGAWSWYENDPEADDKSGKLYNWYAASCCDICPEGWRLPDDYDVDRLASYRFAASSMIYRSSGWANEYTFSSGFRNEKGGFQNSNISSESRMGFSFYWSKNPDGFPVFPGVFMAYSITNTDGSALVVNSSVPLSTKSGAYIKCVKEK